jgi:RHS repeat-associated protein
MVDNNGTSQQATSTYSYDANGSQTSVTDDNGTTIGYQYDPEGDLTCIAYPVVSGSTCTNAPSSTNTVIDRGFNSAGELTSVRDWLGNTTGYGYNPEGNVTSIQYPSSTGEGLSYGYDANQNLKSTTFTGTALQANESWTPNSDELTSSTSQLNGYSSNFSYNDLNAVTQAKNPGASGPDAYQYYSNGQLESDTPPGGSAISYNYNSAEELTSLANPNAGATTSFAYTADGQRCWSAPSSVQNPSCSSPPAGATSYAWSTLGTLCWEAPSSSTNGCGSPPSGSTTFSYNGDGIRSSETAPSGTVSKFTWDTAQATTPELLDDGSNAYVYGPLLFGGAAPVEQISLASGEASFLASVPSGVQAVFTQSGVLQDEASYSTYGSQSDTTTSASPFGFAGGYRDASGLVYLVHRYYDPATGQFMNVDPLDPITGQPYEYAGDNPINASDPLGLDCRNTDTCPSSTSYGATEGSNPTPSPSSYGTPGPTGACGCGLAPTIYSVASNTQQALSSYMCGGGNACAPPSANQSLSEAEPDIACECTGDVGIIGSLATVNTPSLGATATGFALGTCLLGDVPGCLLAQGIALVARSADRRNEPLACQEIQDAFDTSITGIGLGLVAAPFWIAESASPVVSRAGAAVPDISQTALGSPHPSC